MPSPVYDLLSELSSPQSQAETKELMDELKGLLESGETAGKFRSSILDTYYPEFIKTAILTCRKGSKVTDSLYYPVLEILFRKYRVAPDNTDEDGVTPLEFATDRKCKPFMDYLSKGPHARKRKTKKKRKKTKKTKKTKKKASIKKKKKNGSKSRKCYRNATTKRCRK